MERFRLSISNETVKDKASAGRVTGFHIDEIDLTKGFDLELIFRESNYSTNVWKGGKREKATYLGMTGVCLDIDDGMTIDEARKYFRSYKYILHTSTSHQVVKRDKPSCDRFRIILPFEPQDELYFPTIEQAEGLFEAIKQLYPFADPATLEPARHFFPFLGEDDKFILETHLEGEWFSVPEGTLAAKPSSDVEAVKKKIGRKGAQYYIQHDQKILMADGKTEQTIESLRMLLQDVEKQKLPCYCPFCDDVESQNASATVQLTSTHFIQLYCSHCESVGGGQQFVYWEDPIEPGMFMLEDKVVRVMKNKNNAYIVKVSDDYFMEGDKSYAKQYLCRARCIPTADLKVENHASVEYPKVDYHLDIPTGLLTVEIPTAITVDKKDNAFIDRWIEQMFGMHADFIKDWMALYCYTNYQSLPVLVLKGPRGCGKTTFGEVMAEIFPDFSDAWGGESANFTPFFKKKLLLIEENDGNKKEQYVQLKQTTGAAYLTINEKYVPHYKVRNNIKVIITTNEARPMFLVPDEQPTNPNNNNFFIYQAPPVATINPRIKQEVLERLGWYMRTELKKRYDDWKVRQATNTCRYGIPCPITQLEKDLYGSAMTGIDADVELLKNQLLSGEMLSLANDFRYTERQGNGYAARKDDKDGKYYVRMEDLRGIVKALELRAGKLSDLIKRLQDKGIISYEQKRRGDKRLGYQILVPMDDEPKPTDDNGVIFR